MFTCLGNFSIFLDLKFAFGLKIANFIGDLYYVSIPQKINPILKWLVVFIIVLYECVTKIIFKYVG